MSLGPIRQKTVVAQAMERIKNLITSGKYKTGDKFPTEHELAEEFQIGRSSIREALKVFQHLGVLEARVPKGNYVSGTSSISKEALSWSILLGDNDFYDLLEFRLIMEQQGLWYLMEYPKTDDEFKQSIIKSLQREVAAMKDAIDNDNFPKRLEADYRFHQHLIEACNNELFNTIYNTLNELIREEMKFAAQDYDYHFKSPERHQLLIDKIVEGDYQKATEAYRAHIRDVNKVFNHLSPAKGGNRNNKTSP
ncbi:MAG: FadR/GntR family transcriptional regulator [Sphaerochaetaceae bacterium]